MESNKLLEELKSLFDDLSELDRELEVELNKGPNYWKNKDPAKYKKMLAKLRRERKKPGSAERGYQQILQAKRREQGRSGTTAGQGRKGHASGHMKSKTGSAVKRYASAEKKAGTKLSIDRKNNSRGYESKNTRLVPQRLNNGDENRKDKKEYLKRKKK